MLNAGSRSPRDRYCLIPFTGGPLSSPNHGDKVSMAGGREHGGLTVKADRVSVWPD